jgi:Ran GTPase-activating protein (RanGAP) involved in mRNA processing and transport
LAILIDCLDQADKCFLTELNLARNKISDAGADKLSHLLSKNPLLKNLNLHWNKIKIKGGLKIAESLLNNSNLRFLDISWNAIGKVN